MEWATQSLRDIEAQGLFRQLEPLSSPQGPVVEMDSRRYVNFSSNDYLGLAADPEVVAAAQRAASRYGVGTGASRLIVGDTTAHQALERSLAEAFGAPAALLFNSGYQANLGVLSTVVGAGDAVFSDELNHASIVDGCRLSRAQVVVYPHADVAALGRALKAVPARRKLVVTDAVFSMDGDTAPLRELASLANEHQAALMVDEAHAVGVCGASGEGLCGELGVAADLRVGTLGKALGAFGAFVLCEVQTRSWLVNRARSLIFSTALPAAVCEAAGAALQRMRQGGLRSQLWRNIERFSAGLRALRLPAHQGSAIFSVVLGTPERALAASAHLRERGLLAKPIRPPTVPAGTSRLRFALSAAHTDAQLDAALAALAELRLGSMGS